MKKAAAAKVEVASKRKRGGDDSDEEEVTNTVLISPAPLLSTKKLRYVARGFPVDAVFGSG